LPRTGRQRNGSLGRSLATACVAGGLAAAVAACGGEPDPAPPPAPPPTIAAESVPVPPEPAGSEQSAGTPSGGGPTSQRAPAAPASGGTAAADSKPDRADRDGGHGRSGGGTRPPASWEQSQSGGARPEEGAQDPWAAPADEAEASEPVPGW
jgi:hypothetical protein